MGQLFDPRIFNSTGGSGSSSDSFTTIQTPSGTSPVADSSTDTLIFTSSDSSVTISGNSATDTIDFTVPGGGGGSTFLDNAFAVNDASDATKQFKVDAAGTTGTATTLQTSQTTNRTITLPNATDTLVGKATTDTLTNKTLTSPVINTPTGIVKGDVGLGNVDNTSDATKNAAAVTLTNKTIDNTNTISVKDTLFTVQDDGDATKLLAFQVSGVTTGTTRTLTVQDASGTVALTSNKLSAFAATSSSELAGVISDESGSGALVFANTPTLVTPVLGVASATSINKVALTAPASAATLTLADGSTLATSGANSITLTSSGATNVTLPTTGTLATLAGTEALSNKTLGNTNTVTLKDTLFTIQDDGDATKLLAFQVSGVSTGTTRTLTTPDASGTIALTSNKLSAFAATTSSELAGVISDETGSGALVFATTPTLVTPVLGVATATTINKVTITAPATSSTLTIADGSSLITSGANSITLTSSGATNVTLPTTGTLATLAGTEELTNKTLTSSVGKGTWTASGTWVLPAHTQSGNITFGENTELAFPAAALTADGKYCGITDSTYVAGAALAFGEIVYFDAATSRWKLGKADADSTSGAVRIGICVLAAAGNGSATNILTYGKIRADAKFPTLTVGAPVYISAATAGLVTVTQPSSTDQVIRIMGYGTTADEMFFCPSNDYMTHV